MIRAHRMNLQSHVPLRKQVNLNPPAQFPACQHRAYWRRTSASDGEGISLLNRNVVTSATQDAPLSFIKPWCLSFSFNIIFVKYLESTTNPNSDQISAYITLWHGHSSRREGKRISVYRRQVSHSPRAPSSQPWGADIHVAHADKGTWAQRG